MGGVADTKFADQARLIVWLLDSGWVNQGQGTTRWYKYSINNHFCLRVYVYENRHDITACIDFGVGDGRDTNHPEAICQSYGEAMLRITAAVGGAIERNRPDRRWADRTTLSTKEDTP
jgi:hypothetical protein